MAYEPELNAQGQRTVWLEDAMADRLGAMRGPGESYSDVILRTRRDRRMLSAAAGGQSCGSVRRA